jgi:hypothetical protein
MTFVTQAIETKYLNARGGRIKATALAGSITLPYDYALDVQENHKRAATMLRRKLNWEGTFAQGGNVKGDGYYFVNVEGA